MRFSAICDLNFEKAQQQVDKKKLGTGKLPMFDEFHEVLEPS